MIRSNCWAVLALAAQQTRHMRLGTGVNVPGLGLAPVVANGIATINRLAPGRCFIGLGTGTHRHAHAGQKPMRLAPFREYVRVVRKLLGGEEADYTLDGETHPVRFQMREHRFIDLDHRIPLYVAAFGPQGPGARGRDRRRTHLGAAARRHGGRHARQRAPRRGARGPSAAARLLHLARW